MHEFTLGIPRGLERLLENFNSFQNDTSQSEIKIECTKYSLNKWNLKVNTSYKYFMYFPIENHCKY